MANKSAIRVFTDLNAINDKIVKDPLDNAFTIESKKEAKSYQVTRFYDVKVVDTKSESTTKYPLIVKITDITVMGDMIDPNSKKKDEGEKENKTASVKLSVDYAGDYGKLIRTIDGKYNAWCENMKSTKKVDPSTKIHRMIQTTYSFEHPDETKRGQQKENHTLHIKLDFSKYSDKHPRAFLRGLHKTEILDYSTKYVDDKNIIRYKQAEVDGEPVDETNIHKFITRGSRIIEGRIHMESVSKSSFGFSLSQLAGRLVVESAPMGSFEGDEVEANAEERITKDITNEKVDSFVDSV